MGSATHRQNFIMWCRNVDSRNRKGVLQVSCVVTTLLQPFIKHHDNWSNLSQHYRLCKKNTSIRTMVAQSFELFLKRPMPIFPLAFTVPLPSRTFIVVPYCDMDIVFQQSITKNLKRRHYRVTVNLPTPN